MKTGSRCNKKPLLLRTSSDTWKMCLPRLLENSNTWQFIGPRDFMAIVVRMYVCASWVYFAIFLYPCLPLLPHQASRIITSAKEVMSSSALAISLVCLFVSRIMPNTIHRLPQNSMKRWVMGHGKKPLDYGGYADHVTLRLGLPWSYVTVMWDTSRHWVRLPDVCFTVTISRISDLGWGMCTTVCHSGYYYCCCCFCCFQPFICLRNTVKCAIMPRPHIHKSLMVVVCLSIPCLTLTWEWNGIASWKLVGRKPITRVTIVF